MAKEKRNLKKLSNCEKQGVNGGTIFYGQYDVVYYVADPTRRKTYKHSGKKAAQESARLHGVSTEVVICGSGAAALEAAQRAAGILPRSLAEATNLNAFLAQISKL